MKTCTKCGVQKPLEGFYYRKDNGKYRNPCKECQIKRLKRQYNAEKKKKYNKEYYKKNRAKCLLKVSSYAKKNREKINVQRKQRFQIDEKHHLKECLRGRIKEAMKGRNKSTSTLKLLGNTVEYVKKFLELQMTDTMTFNNIHIDHMMPLNSFDLTKPEEQHKAFHYTNLQPMLPSKNMSKGNKIIYDMRWNGQQWEINRSGIYEPRDKLVNK